MKFVCIRGTIFTGTEMLEIENDAVVNKRKSKNLFKGTGKQGIIRPFLQQTCRKCSLYGEGQ